MSDNRALAHVEEAPVRQSDNLLAQVIAAAKDPTVDAGKMETLARLVNSQQDREREIEFNRDLNAAVMEMPVITRAGEIIIPANSQRGTPERKQGRFARFEDIDRVCRPILARYNLAIRFEIGTTEAAQDSPAAVTVRPILTHANGHTERGEAMRVPADTSGSKNAAQAVGSSTQYGKRYSYCAILNIVTEGVDDDANQGRGLKVDMPDERARVVEEDARLAHSEGRYMDWFWKQGPKDRMWLLGQQFHVEFGGTAPQLTAPPPPPPPPPPSEEDERETQTRKRTPEQLVDDFKAKLDEEKTSRGVIDLQADPKVAKFLGDLEDRHHQLWKEATNYAAERYKTLSAKEREAARKGGEDGGPLL